MFWSRGTGESGASEQRCPRGVKWTNPSLKHCKRHLESFVSTNVFIWGERRGLGVWPESGQPGLEGLHLWARGQVGALLASGRLDGLGPGSPQRPAARSAEGRIPLGLRVPTRAHPDANALVGPPVPNVSGKEIPTKDLRGPGGAALAIRTRTETEKYLRDPGFPWRAAGVRAGGCRFCSSVPPLSMGRWTRKVPRTLGGRAPATRSANWKPGRKRPRGGRWVTGRSLCFASPPSSPDSARRSFPWHVVVNAGRWASSKSRNLISRLRALEWPGAWSSWALMTGYLGRSGGLGAAWLPGGQGGRSAPSASELDTQLSWWNGVQKGSSARPLFRLVFSG